MRSAILFWPMVIITSGVAIGLITFLDLDAPWRPVLAFWFLLVCPGMSLARLLRLRDGVAEWTLAIALSLALDSITAIAMLYAGAWSIKLGLLLLVLLSIAGASLQVVLLSRQPPERLGSGSATQGPV